MSLPFSQPASTNSAEGGVRQLNSAKLFSADETNKLHILWEDGERLFCRGERHADADHAGVLVVLPTLEHPAPATLDRLAHEYELKDELDRSWGLFSSSAKAVGLC